MTVDDRLPRIVLRDQGEAQMPFQELCPGADRPVPNFADPAVRARLSKSAAHAMVRIADLWKITDTDACSLLGDFPAQQWAEMKSGNWTGVFSEAELYRLSAIIGTFKAVHLFSKPLADEWVRRPNTNEIFGGRRPLDYMIAGGFEAILITRQYLEAVAQGY